MTSVPSISSETFDSKVNARPQRVEKYTKVTENMVDQMAIVDLDGNVCLGSIMSAGDYIMFWVYKSYDDPRMGQRRRFFPCWGGKQGRDKDRPKYQTNRPSGTNWEEWTVPIRPEQIHYMFPALERSRIPEQDYAKWKNAGNAAVVLLCSMGRTQNEGTGFPSLLALEETTSEESSLPAVEGLPMLKSRGLEQKQQNYTGTESDTTKKKSKRKRQAAAVVQSVQQVSLKRPKIFSRSQDNRKRKRD